jgi:hypothetical protein
MALSAYEVVKGIYQAVANKHHGARNEKGEVQEIGLKRESQDPRNQQIMDGFGITIHGNLLLVKYHSVEPIRDLHQKKFEKEIERRIEEVKSFIVKEYSRLTKTSLKLREAGEIAILVETPNRMKAHVKAQMAYEIGNLKDVVAVGNEKASEQKHEERVKASEKLVKGALKPKNAPRKDK